MASLQLVGDQWFDVEFDGLQLAGDQWIEGAGAGGGAGFDPELVGSGVIADEIRRALGSGHINDLMAAHFGKTANETLQDAERRFLIANGATPATLADMWVELYGTGVNKKSVNSAKLAYWANQ